MVFSLHFKICEYLTKPETLDNFLIRSFLFCFDIVDTLKVENFAGTKFRGSKKRNFCVSRVLNFAVAPSK